MAPSLFEFYYLESSQIATVEFAPKVMAPLVLKNLWGPCYVNDVYLTGQNLT